MTLFHSYLLEILGEIFFAYFNIEMTLKQLVAFNKNCAEYNFQPGLEVFR